MPAWGALVLALAGCNAPHGSVPILAWHSIGAGDDKFSVTSATFSAQLDALAQAGFTPLTLRDVVSAQDAHATLPARPVVLTFDDGLEDAYTTALPALQAHKMRGTFFIVSKFVAADAAHRTVAHDKVALRRYLTVDELRALAAAGMEIGSHTQRHPRMPDLDAESARQELSGSKADLEALIGAPVTTFAYPFNSVRPFLPPLVAAAGYRAAVAGMVHGNDSRMQLFRMTVEKVDAPGMMKQLCTTWPASCAQ
ncbi:MAG: polysaccharide deacetylase family protein [Deltaproteobacteria bacterium]|nr:polysaccharide deacetylase family protein [Deltaproteobacteria bacterium]